MKIAVLAWGSLIWDKRELPKIKGDWALGGPVLPLEFSRISKSRACALTLVIDPQNGVQLPTRFAISSHGELEDAICDLRCREDTLVKRIGYVNLVTGLIRSNELPKAADVIRRWARDNEFDAVIWTDLCSNFQDKTSREFSVDHAVEYLHTLSAEDIDRAHEYITKAPPEIDTPLRQYLGNDSWFNGLTQS